jgi:hypothetical protein
MPRNKRTGPEPVTPTEFARRHVISALSSTRGLIVMVVASVTDPATGRARITQREIAYDMGKSLATVERGMRWLLADGSGPALAKARGRGYLLVGFPEHDPYRCGNVECEAEWTIPLASMVQRAKAAERVRRWRERQRAAKAAAEGR